MSHEATSENVERVLYVWDRGDGRFGGRLLHGSVVRGRYEQCPSAEGVKALATAFGEHFDRVEAIDPVPWQDIAGAHLLSTVCSTAAETLESDLIERILHLNTGQRKRLLNQIANRPLEERVQFIEHCNDLATGVSRTMLGSPGV